MSKGSKKSSGKKHRAASASFVEAMLAVPALKEAWVAAIEAGAAAAIATLRSAPQENFSPVASATASTSKTPKKRKKKKPIPEVSEEQVNTAESVN